MRNFRPTLARWVQFGTFVLLWLGFLFFTEESVAIDAKALGKLPFAITGYAVLHLLFTAWLWKLPFLRGWLVPFPNLEGTWVGEIRSTWQGPSGHETLPIQAQMIISQSFSQVTCTVRTTESESTSRTASITEKEHRAGWLLSFTYTNRPRASVRDRSSIHDGAAVLHLSTRPERRIEGEYWTSRRTTGEMAFTFQSREK